MKRGLWQSKVLQTDTSNSNQVDRTQLLKVSLGQEREPHRIQLDGCTESKVSMYRPTLLWKSAQKVRLICGTSIWMHEQEVTGQSWMAMAERKLVLVF